MAAFRTVSTSAGIVVCGEDATTLDVDEGATCEVVSNGEGITGDCSGERPGRHDSLVEPCRPEGGSRCGSWCVCDGGNGLGIDGI